MSPTSISITYNGRTYRRYPDSENAADRRYYKPSGADRKHGVQALHQEVWKDAHGVDAIPEGFHVHHADHDTENNAPDNLVLIQASAHATHHMTTPERQEMSREAIKVAQEAARAWHSSPEGVAWHSEHGRQQWEKREPRRGTCDQCGEPFDTLAISPVRFCSNRCKSAWRRESGLDDEDRTCPVCGQMFRVNRYSQSRSCSRRCAWVLRRSGD